MTLPRIPTFMVRLLPALLLLAGAARAQTVSPLEAPPAADAVALYNEACARAAAGDLAAAGVALRAAVAAGFDDFGFAAEDPDLAALRRQPLFGELAAEHAERLAAAAAQRRQDLVRDRWSDPAPLDFVTPADPAGAAGFRPALRLRWGATALELELTLAGPWTTLFTARTAPPWAGGPSVVVAVTVPDGSGPAESRDHFLFAFGRDKETPVGAVWVPEQASWQRVLELDPEVRDDGGNLVVVARVPWRSLAPYHPLVDPQLGLNVAVGAPTAAGLRQAALLRDPGLFDPGRAVRRGVPLTFARERVPEEAFLAALDRTVTDGAPLALELVALAAEAGTGRLSLDFQDNRGRSVLPGGGQAAPLPLAAGLNRLSRQADFASLPTGNYRLRAELTFPSGFHSVWSANILHLAPGWEEALRLRIGDLKGPERPTAEHYLDTALDALRERLPRRSPAPIATTLTELDLMLEAAAAGGSLLPEVGLLQGAYRGPDGGRRLCTLYLPPRWREAAAVRPVVVLNDEAEMTGRLGERLARHYAERAEGDAAAPPPATAPVYLLPHAVAPRGDAPAALTEADRCLEWARELFGVPRLAIAGLDAAGGAALGLARDRAAGLTRVLIVAGGGLDPWPQADLPFLAERLGPAPGDLPVTWIDFPEQTAHVGQAPLLLQALREQGWQLAAVQEARGGYHPYQAIDRLVLWARESP